MTEYTVYLKMEGGQKLIWQGVADDGGHAEGQAIAWANEKTGEQVYDCDYEIGEEV